MTPDQIDLARRLVACRRWRWMAGMLSSGRRVVLADADAVCGTAVRKMWSGGWESVGVYIDDLPDLTDPATAGCLLAMLVAADPGAGWGVSCGPDVGWRATSCAHDLSGATCGEALARALLVVWEAA